MSDCYSSAKTGTTLKHKRSLQQFATTRPLEFVAIDMLGPLPRTTEGNQRNVIITDRYSKLIRSVPTAKITTTAVTCMFFGAGATPYGILLNLLVSNNTHFFRNVNGSLCIYLGTKHTTTTAFHPQTTVQVERCNKTFETRLSHYVATNHRDWNLFVQPSTYANNLQVLRSTNNTPFSHIPKAPIQTSPFRQSISPYN